MTKRVLISILAIFASLASFAQYKVAGYSSLNDSETISSLRNHVSYLSSSVLEGRGAGSDGEGEAADYLSDVLESYGVDVISGKEGDIFGIRQDNGDTLRSRNVIGYIQGYDKNLRDHYIVIGARMDNMNKGVIVMNGVKKDVIYYGANGNASGMAMLLELGRMLKTNSNLLRRSVLLVGFGSSAQSFAGAWYFLNRSFKDVKNIDAMIDLDILGIGSNGFYSFSVSNPDMDQYVKSLASTLQPIYPENVSMQPYPSDNVAFYDATIPSILFTTGKYPEHNTEKDNESIIQYDYMEKELEYIYNYSVSLINGPKPIFNVGDELKKRNVEDNVVPYYDCDRFPSFLGSSDPKVFLEKWVYKYLRYPPEAVQQGIQGKVLVDFVIDEKGKITDVKILKGVDPLLDNEALRVIKASPDWKPGYVLGNKVKAELSMYIEFRLQKKKR